MIGIAAPVPSAAAADENWAFDVVSVKHTDVRVSTYTPGQSKVATAVSDAAAKSKAQKLSAEATSTD